MVKLRTYFLHVALTGPRPVQSINRLHSWSHWQSICHSPNTYPGMAILPPIHALGHSKEHIYSSHLLRIFGAAIKTLKSLQCT